MDLLTSSFHSEYGNNMSFEKNHFSSVNPNDKFEFPDDLIDFECMLAGRKSFSFEGRDSLGILQNFETIVLPKLTLEPIQEVSLVDTKSREDIFLNSSGNNREVLYDDKRDSFKKIVDVKSASNNLLNIKLPSTSSVSSYGSSFRPSLWSLDYESDELSKIYSINSRENVNSLNTAFYSTNKTEVKHKNSEDKKVIHVETDEFNDTVFSTGKIVASIFDDGSIVGNISDDLYFTHPPEFTDITLDDDLITQNNTDVENHTDQKIHFQNTELSPVKLTQHKLCDNQLENNSCENTNDSIRHENNQIHHLMLPQSAHILNTSISPKFCNSRNSRSLDLLNNLSNIINTEKIENQSQVKRILQDLADVLLIRDSKELNDDSGRSSIEENVIESLKNDSDENVGVKGLEKRLSQSLCSTKTSEGLKIASASNSSAKTRQRSLDDLQGVKKATVKKPLMPQVKLRPRKNDIDSLKKGPMKAVIPLANMKRRSIVHPKNINITPKNALGNLYAKTRTSTPNTWNAIPVAQSTPEQLNHAAQSIKAHTSLQNSCGENITSQLSKLSTLNTSFKRPDSLNRSNSSSVPNISRGDSPSKIPALVPLISASAKCTVVSRRRSESEIKYTSSVDRKDSRKSVQSALVRYEKRESSVTVGVNASKGGCSSGCNVGVKGDGGGRMAGVKSCLSERNRNLVQYIKPLNLLEKMKK